MYEIGRQNKMKRKTGLSLMMALLMVFSVFTVITPSVTAVSESYIEVTKEVCDGESWEDDTEAEYGDTVQFKITVTYYNESNNCASSIVVTDTLPAGLEYEETLEPEEPEPEVTGNTLVWDFGEEQLCHGDSITIKFNAVVVGGNYGENVNTVNVTAKELCGPNDLFDEDTAIVFVNPSVDVDKKVWDPDAQEWVEHLDSVIKEVDVQFRIVVTYHGDITMKCMKVIDFLPEECLEYADNVYIEINGEEIKEDDPRDRYPEITVTEHYGGDKTKIMWDWRNVTFVLHDGESVIIKFDANVTDYCYDEYTITNIAFAHLRGCYGCQEDNHVWDCDTATVNCRPHDPVFEKKVWDGNKWVEETTAYVGDYVLFKIELTYYGSYNLSDIRIVDELPEKILEYTYNATVEESNVSEDRKTIWWNITDVLNDSETLVIKFKALVIGDTGNCDCGINTASYNAVESVTEFEYDGEDDAKVTSTHRPPVPPVELDICIKRFSLGRVSASIKNVGDEDVSDVEWTINVKKGGVLYRWERGRGSSIDLIEAGKSAGICTGHKSILRKFGRITITVTATVGEETFTETAKGFVFGRIILVRPLIRFGR